jgi:tRNA pseudouridine synthase 9
VFSREFKAFSKQYYIEAIGTGRITVKGKIVETCYKLKDGDKIVHKTVREETPILSDLPTVIYENDTIIAVNKPPSVPVHPCGNFKNNSLTSLLELCLKIPGLKSVHRLDR